MNGSKEQIRPIEMVQESSSNGRDDPDDRMLSPVETRLVSLESGITDLSDSPGVMDEEDIESESHEFRVLPDDVESVVAILEEIPGTLFGTVILKDPNTHTHTHIIPYHDDGRSRVEQELTPRGGD